MFQEIVHTRYHPLSSQKAFTAVDYALLLFVVDSSDTKKVHFVSFFGVLVGWLFFFKSILRHKKKSDPLISLLELHGSITSSFNGLHAWWVSITSSLASFACSFFCSHIGLQSTYSSNDARIYFLGPNLIEMLCP